MKFVYPFFYIFYSTFYQSYFFPGPRGGCTISRSRPRSFLPCDDVLALPPEADLDPLVLAPPPPPPPSMPSAAIDLSNELGMMPRMPPLLARSPLPENSLYEYFHSSRKPRTARASLSLPPLE